MLDIPNYKIEKELGAGGMSTVYLATHTILDRQVALKIMSPSYLNNEAFRDCFINEGKIISKLNNPHIIHIYDIGISHDACYMAIELLEQDTLHQKIENKSLSFEDIERIISQVASALTTAHSQNFIHRDIKPKNILFRQNGDAVLTDFGISKVQNTEGDLTSLGYMSGTPSYMPPEHSMGEDLDHRGDIYSLGIVLYEMLTGEKPYQAKTPAAISYEHVNAPIPRLEANLAHYQTVIDQSLAKKPQDRFDSALEFANAVKMADPLSAPTIIAARENTSFDDAATVILANPNARLSQSQIQQPPKKGNFILLSVGIMALLVGLGISAYFKFYKPSEIITEAKTVTTETTKENLLVLSSPQNPPTSELNKPEEVVIKENKYPALPEIAPPKETKDSISVPKETQNTSFTLEKPSKDIKTTPDNTITTEIETSMLAPASVTPLPLMETEPQNIETPPAEIAEPEVPDTNNDLVIASTEDESPIQPSSLSEGTTIKTIKTIEKPKTDTLSKEQITIITSLLDNCLVRASSAIKEHIRITKNEGIIKEIQNLKMDSGRTKFITDTRRQMQISQEKFNDNISLYYENLTKLKAYKVKSIHEQVTIIKNKPTTRKINQDITEIISRHFLKMDSGNLTLEECKNDFSNYANNILNSF